MSHEVLLLGQLWLYVVTSSCRSRFVSSRTCVSVCPASSVGVYVSSYRRVYVAVRTCVRTSVRVRRPSLYVLCRVVSCSRCCLLYV